jgi:membrane-associated phospholipid phosphatase
MFLIPVVALGRVYFRCHWIGDTIGGIIIGGLFAFLGYLSFTRIAEVLMYYLPGFISFWTPA